MFLEFSVKGQNLCEQKFPVSISAFSANVPGLDYKKNNPIWLSHLLPTTIFTVSISFSPFHAMSFGPG